ncbi:MAG: hypothetical protein ACRDLK_13555 [Gaiellaceae bacterium]
MTNKKPRVPEMREPKPNREQRRHPDGAQRPEDEQLARDEHAPDQQAPPKRQDVYRGGPQDVTSTRAKSSGHKKKTADNWNQ